MWLPDYIGPRNSSLNRCRRMQRRRPLQLLLQLLFLQLFAGTQLVTGWRFAAAAAAALTGKNNGSEEVLGGTPAQIESIMLEEGPTAPLASQQKWESYVEAAVTTAAEGATANAVIYAAGPARDTSTATPRELPAEPIPVDENKVDDWTPSGDGESDNAGDDEAAIGRAASSGDTEALSLLRLLQNGERPTATIVAADSAGSMLLPDSKAADRLQPLPHAVAGSDLATDEEGAAELGNNAATTIPQPATQLPTVRPFATTAQPRASSHSEQADASSEADDAAAHNDLPESGGIGTSQAASISPAKPSNLSWAEAEDGQAMQQIAVSLTARQLNHTPDSAPADDDRQQQPHGAVEGTTKSAVERSGHPAESSARGVELTPSDVGEDNAAAAAVIHEAASDALPSPMWAGYYDRKDFLGYGYTALHARTTTDYVPWPSTTDSSSHVDRVARNNATELPSMQGTSGEGTTAINRNLLSTQGAYRSDYPSMSTDFEVVSLASIVIAAAGDAEQLADKMITAADTPHASGSISDSRGSSDCCSTAVPNGTATKHSANPRNASAVPNATAASAGQLLNISPTTAIKAQSPSGEHEVATEDSPTAEIDEIFATAIPVGASDSSTTAQLLLLLLRSSLPEHRSSLETRLDSGHYTQRQQQLDEAITQAQHQIVTITVNITSGNATQLMNVFRNDSRQAPLTPSLSSEAGYSVTSVNSVSMPRTDGAHVEHAVDIRSSRLPGSTPPADSSNIRRFFALLPTAAEGNVSRTTLAGLENRPDEAAHNGSRVEDSVADTVDGSSNTATGLTSSKHSIAPTSTPSAPTAITPSVDLRFHMPPPRGASKPSVAPPPVVPQPQLPASTSRKPHRPGSTISHTTASAARQQEFELGSKISANGDGSEAVAGEALQPLAQPGVQRLQVVVELRATAKPSAVFASTSRTAEHDSSTPSSAIKGTADHGIKVLASDMARSDRGSGSDSNDGHTADADDGWSANSTVVGVATGSAVAVCLAALGLAVWLVKRRSRRLQRRQRQHRGKGLGGGSNSTSRRGCRRHDEHDEREARYALHQTEHSLLEDLVMLELAKARSRGYVCDSDKVNYDEVFNLNAAISNQMITEL